jgi:hypothetical protein
MWVDDHRVRLCGGIGDGRYLNGTGMTPNGGSFKQPGSCAVGWPAG